MEARMLDPMSTLYSELPPGTSSLWPWAPPAPKPARPHLRATLRDLGPWYLVLTASAFSRKRSDRSYSITPCSTSPMLFWGQREGPGQSCFPRTEARPATALRRPPSTHIQQCHLGVVLPEHEQGEVAGAVQQAQGRGQLAAGEAVQGQVHLRGQPCQARRPRSPPAGPAPTGCSHIPGWCWGARCPSLARSSARPSVGYSGPERGGESSPQGGELPTLSLPGPQAAPKRLSLLSREVFKTQF